MSRPGVSHWPGRTSSPWTAAQGGGAGGTDHCQGPGLYPPLHTATPPLSAVSTSPRAEVGAGRTRGSGQDHDPELDRRGQAGVTGRTHHSHSLSAVSLSRPPSCASLHTTPAPGLAQAEVAFSEEMG